MSTSPPQVSVVVPTRDRPERLAAVLEALRGQTLPAEAFEVIVVDDGSATPGTGSVLSQYAARGELGVRAVRHGSARGTAGARNSGWRAARAPLVAFTDDDCVPVAGWLAAGLAAAGGCPGAIIQGRTEPNPAELERRGVFSRTICVTALGPQYEACNIFYPRALLERVGGFDEGFGRFSAGEDTDLAWRALTDGARAAYAPDALVYHAVHVLGPLRTLREAARLSQTAIVFARHPGTRVMLNRRLFWNGWHYLVVRSLVALALPPPLRRFLLTRHALQLVERARAAGAGWRAVPFLFLYDAIETGAVAWGGVRHRTPVL
ncbi:MAG TPA: glycosyltransferase [Solirubrobacteraceae bacterium]|nr:glycosyltransferase [Solirubrobacteraceae bacterium]